MSTKILSHFCKNDYQDFKYGKGMRVFNVLKNISKARCTVCGGVVDIKVDVPVKEEKPKGKTK